MQQILSKKHWIFDLDGTLTVPVHDFPGIRKELGIPDGADILKFIRAQSNAHKSELLKKLDEIEVELALNSKPADGVKVLVNQLDKLGVKKGIITRNTKSNTIISLKKIGVFSSFLTESIIGRDEAPAKPDPAGIIQLCEAWHIAPAQTNMVGDYLFDIQTGRSAGASVIHIDHDGKGIWKEMTDIQVKSLTELSVLLKTTINAN